MDFIHDGDERDRPLKWLSVVDEFTRECPALDVERGMSASGIQRGGCATVQRFIMVLCTARELIKCEAFCQCAPDH